MTKIVGIVNVTPDSFSDGGKFFKPHAAIEQVKLLFEKGASIVDIGAESTRPNATPLSAAEEWERLEPILRAVLPRFPGRISLDSYHPETVRKAFALGDVIVNDVTGLNNPDMQAVILELKPRVIVSHLLGGNVQAAHSGMPISELRDVKNGLLEKVELLLEGGLAKEKIILDPGIGFGKTMELNKKLLRFAEVVPDFQVMIGYSRKRFLGVERNTIEANLEAGKIAISSGAAFIRVHDVISHTSLLN